MNKSMLAVLNDAERLLVAETEPAALEALDEDGAAALHDRIRRARNKYTGQYRRGASAKVAGAGGRGKARPTNTRAAMKAEVFEDALARVSRRLAVLAKQSAADLRAERIAAARAVKEEGRATAGPSAATKRAPATAAATKQAAGTAVAEEPAAKKTAAKKSVAARSSSQESVASRGTRRTVTQKPSGDQALRSPAREKARASTKATGARRQAKRDSR